MPHTFTLHVDAGASPEERSLLERAVVVRDGFSWGAFVFTAFWFFWNRLWLAGLAVLAGLVVFHVGLRLMGVPPAASVLAGLLVSALIGLEATSLRRWTLARRGRPAVDVVLAADHEEAETKSFARFLSAGEPLEEGILPRSPRTNPWPQRDDAVIGLFPDRDRMR